MDENDIAKSAISSTTTCEENYEKIILEFKELISFGGKRIIPVLWLTPNMFKSNKIEFFSNCGIKWKCIKIHGFIHNWYPNGKLLKRVIDTASKMGVPILFHTGGKKRCEVEAYSKLIKNNPNLIFILAHGRPVEQAIEVMKRNPNVWVDTAFMQIDNVLQLIECGLENRILFGSDFPITKHHYPEINDAEWYKKRIAEFSFVLNDSIFIKIFKSNFEKIFK